MKKNQPRKPTVPFGSIVFGDDGSVRRSISKLPETKVAQELEVANRFCELLRKYQGLDVSAPISLDEFGHDAAITVMGISVQLQITEISPREFELPPGSPNQGDPKAIGFFSATSTFATSLDIDALNESVLNAIRRKIEKHYVREVHTKLWLLVFSTSPFIKMEHFKDGELKIGEPLRRARAYFDSNPWLPFDEVWFSNLQLRPVRVLPPLEITA